MARFAQIGLLLIVAAGGVAIGRATVDAPSDPRALTPARAAAAAPPAVSAINTAINSDALRADIRRILHEELQLARQPEAVQRQVAEPPEVLAAAAAAAESPQAQAAADQGRRIVDGALAARRWREQDVLAIRQVLPQMASADRDALLRDLMPAINSGRVALEAVGAIF